MSSSAYSPREYWNKREHPNTLEVTPITDIEESFFPPIIAAASSLIEVGPGVGRLFQFYRSVGNITTLDLSRNYGDRAREEADRCGIKVNQTYLDDVADAYPFEDNAFDLGVSSLVLQHVPFENVGRALSELTRVCDRVAVSCSIRENWPKPGEEYDPKSHCFVHDYRALCHELGVSLIFYDDRSPHSVRFICRSG